MTYYVSPATSTMPDLTGTRIKLLPCLYEGSANQYYAHRVTNHLRCLKDDTTGMFDPDACDAMAAHYLSGDVDRLVFDWERADNEDDRRDFMRCIWRLQDRGLIVGRFGCEPYASKWDRHYTRQGNDGEVHPALYQFTLDLDLWLSDRNKKLDAIRKAYPDAEVTVWLWPFHEQDGDGPGNEPIPVHQYVGDVMWKAQLAWAKRRKVNVCLWTGREQLTEQGDYKPFPTESSFWKLYLEAAK